MIQSDLLTLSESILESGSLLRCWKDGRYTYYEIDTSLFTEQQCRLNQFALLGDADPIILRVIDIGSNSVRLREIDTLTRAKRAIWGITAKNKTQSMALELLTDNSVDGVLLMGPIGAGKRILSLAAALSQIFDQRRYSELCILGPTPHSVASMFRGGVSKKAFDNLLSNNLKSAEKAQKGNITYFDVDAVDRARLTDSVEDTLGHLTGTEGSGDWGKEATMNLMRSRMKVRTIHDIYGRLLVGKFVVLSSVEIMSATDVAAVCDQIGPGCKLVLLAAVAGEGSDTNAEGEGTGCPQAIWEAFGSMGARGGRVMLDRAAQAPLSELSRRIRGA